MIRFNCDVRMFLWCENLFCFIAERYSLRIISLIARRYPQQTQKNCITFVQRRPNVFDVGPALYKCHTKVFCLMGKPFRRCGMMRQSRTRPDKMRLNKAGQVTKCITITSYMPHFGPGLSLKNHQCRLIPSLVQHRRILDKRWENVWYWPKYMAVK